MATAADQCALGPDGQLLNASEIQFFFDPDDDKPMQPLPPKSIDHSSSTNNPPIDAFTVLLARPGEMSAAQTGARRSRRVGKPSEKLRDANSTTAAPKKHPLDPTAASSVVTHRHRRAVVTDSDDDVQLDNDDKSNGEDVGNHMSTESDAEAAYQETKALGDADRAVCNPCYLFQFILHDRLQVKLT
jgi:hypothetical protein